MKQKKTNTLRSSRHNNSETIDLKSLEPWLRKLWRHKVKFCKEKFGFSDAEAKEWASQTVAVCRDGESELTTK